MTYVTPLFMRWLRFRTGLLSVAAVMLCTSLAVPQTQATTTQSTTQSSGQSTTPSTAQPPTKQQQQNPEAGGPQGDTGPIAVPKKKPEETPPPEKTPKIKNPEGLEDFSLRVNVPLVTVDVSVMTKDGQFIPGLKGGNFKIYEDGVEQKITNFNQSSAPITAVLLLEF